MRQPACQVRARRQSCHTVVEIAVTTPGQGAHRQDARAEADLWLAECADVLCAAAQKSGVCAVRPECRVRLWANLESQLKKVALEARAGSVPGQFCRARYVSTHLAQPENSRGTGSGRSQQGRRWAGRIGLTAEERSPTPESGSMTMQRCVHACARGAGGTSSAACCHGCPHICARSTPGPPSRRRGSVVSRCKCTHVHARHRLPPPLPPLYPSTMATLCRALVLTRGSMRPAELQPGAHGGDAHARRRGAQRRAGLAVGPHEGQDGGPRAPQPARGTGRPQGQSQKEVRVSATGRRQPLNKPRRSAHEFFSLLGVDIWLPACCRCWSVFTASSLQGAGSHPQSYDSKHFPTVSRNYNPSCRSLILARRMETRSKCISQPGHSRSQYLTSMMPFCCRREAREDVDAALPRKRRTAAVGASVLDLDAAGFYKPLTRQTRDAYEALLDTIQVRTGQATEWLVSGHCLSAHPAWKRMGMCSRQRCIQPDSETAGGRR